MKKKDNYTSVIVLLVLTVVGYFFYRKVSIPTANFNNSNNVVVDDVKKENSDAVSDLSNDGRLPNSSSSSATNGVERQVGYRDPKFPWLIEDLNKNRDKYGLSDVVIR